MDDNKSIKKSFVLMRDLLSTVDLMTDEEAGKVLKAIINHVDGIDVNLPRELIFAFTPIRNQLNRDMDKYDKFVDKQRVNGAKGGRPKKPKPNPNNPSLILETQANPNNLVTVTDNVNDTVNVNDNKSKHSRFAPPSKQELEGYIAEKNLLMDSDSFIDFYQSKGWQVGKNKMKDWKASARNWARKNNNGNNNERTQPTSRATRYFDTLRDIERNC